MSDAITQARKNRLVIGGIYRHFKGDMYVVLGVAKDSEQIISDKVMYFSLSEGKIWYRALHGEDGWFTPKVIDDKEVERFTHVGYAEVRINEHGKYQVRRTY